MNLHLSNRQLFLYGFAVVLFGILIGSVSLTYPFGRDQGFYAYIGSLLLEGKMNYLHAFDLRPPGSQFLFAFSQLLTGKSMINFRIFDLSWQILTAYVLFIISFRLTERRSLSLIASFIYLFLYYRQDYWHTLQADGLLNLPLAVSILLLIASYDKHSFLKIFFSGFLFAISLMFKYTIILFLPLVFICLLVSQKEIFSLRVKNIAYFIIGITLPIILLVALFYVKGAINEFINLQFVQTPLYTKIAYETETREYILGQLTRLFTVSVYAPLIFLSVFTYVFILVKRKMNLPNALAIFWFISSLLSLIIQWKFYYYHFLVIIPPLALGTVLFFSIIQKYLLPGKGKLANALIVVFVLGYVSFAAKPYISNYETLFALISGKESLQEVYIKNGFTTDSVFMISKSLNAVNYVKQNSEPDDLIYVWGYDPLVYYLSGRECVSRFVYNIPLLWKADNADFRTEFMKELSAKYPKLILITSGDPLYNISGYNEDSKQLLYRFKEFSNFIDKNYVFKEKIDDYDYYELKNW